MLGRYTSIYVAPCRRAPKPLAAARPFKTQTNTQAWIRMFRYTYTYLRAGETDLHASVTIGLLSAQANTRAHTQARTHARTHTPYWVAYNCIIEASVSAQCLWTWAYIMIQWQCFTHLNIFCARMFTKNPPLLLHCAWNSLRTWCCSVLPSCTLSVSPNTVSKLQKQNNTPRKFSDAYSSALPLCLTAVNTASKSLFQKSEAALRLNPSLDNQNVRQCRGEEIGRARARARAIKGWSMPTTEAGCMAPPSPASVVKTSLPVRARELCTRERHKMSSSVRYFVPFNSTKCTTLNWSARAAAHRFRVSRMSVRACGAWVIAMLLILLGLLRERLWER